MPTRAADLRRHYVISGLEDGPYAGAIDICLAPLTVYSGGVYHGRLLFPPEYPLKPPGIMMITPNGRFECNTRWVAGINPVC